MTELQSDRVRRTRIETHAQFFASLTGLIDAWCDRRCLGALRLVLQGYPMASGLTDEWGELAVALENVRAFAHDEITESELRVVEDAAVFARGIAGRS